MFRLLAALSLALLALIPAHADTRFTVDTILGEWTDTARSNRLVPYKIYVARETAAAAPLVIFSHGLGGDREGAEYLLSFLAEHGYVAVAVQHAGSDTPAVFGRNGFDEARMQEGIKNAITPAAATDRFRDIPFAIDELTKMNRDDSRLKGRLDMSRIGMSGHSYGAATTLAIAGQAFGPGGRFSFADTRVKAAIAYSPNKPLMGDPVEAMTPIRTPTFHMTGTRDFNPLNESDPVENRQVPYRSIRNADKFLIVFKDGDHMIYSGRGFLGETRTDDPRFHAWIQKASLAFWDAYLKANADAKAYLTGGKFVAELGQQAAFEFQLR